MPTSPPRAILPEVPKLNPGVRLFTPTPVRDAAQLQVAPARNPALPQAPKEVAQGKTTIRITLPKPAVPTQSPIPTTGPIPTPTLTPTSTSGGVQVKKGVIAAPSASYGPRRMTEEAGHPSGNAPPRSPWDQIISDYLGGSDGRSGRRMTTLD